jgi:hypothetical protein
MFVRADNRVRGAKHGCAIIPCVAWLGDLVIRTRGRGRVSTNEVSPAPAWLIQRVQHSINLERITCCKGQIR